MAFTILSMTADDDERKEIVFKGKSTKSWPQLPPEIIRLIATYHLLNVASTVHCPATWEVSQMWPSRFLFALLRDVVEMEQLMCIYASWGAALEYHLFWRQACAMIDPQDALIHHSIVRPTATAGSATATPVRLSPYHHFRNVTNYSCMVCRINYPYSTKGLGVAKRAVVVPLLGTLSTCKDHRKTTYCGVCLREAPAIEGELEYAQGLSMCCVENEDEETWPGVEATCRSCRNEWLWRRVQHSETDREAIGGPKMISDDWETRQAMDAFIDLGEGTIREVVEIARDKYWYKVNTKLNDMLSQALAASRYVSRTEAGEPGYTSEDELSEDEEEDDAELMSITEDAAGIREIAITDYARNRILDGHWISPVDIFRNNKGCHILVPAVHPCPWNPDATYTGALEDGEEDYVDGLTHPRPKTVHAMLPPSNTLCNMTYQAHIKLMRDILLPAMKNLVRRLVIESAADGKDPTVVASQMSFDQVAEALRDEAVWFNGIDWLERRVNAREREREHGREKDEDDSSTSSRSGGSHMTSPVLSTTTLQTTPSPPPSGSVSTKDDESVASPTSSNPPAIEVSPVLKSPQLLHPIPYIPMKVSHLPEYSYDAFKYVWRDATAPLYQCFCSVCTRRMLKADVAAADSVSTEVAPPVQETVQPEEILVPEVTTELMRAAEEEEEGESEKDDSSVVALPAPPVTPRKRSSQELDADACSDLGERRAGSPPKRPRKDGTYSPSVVVSPSPTAARLRKRSSEELEDDESEPLQTGNGDSKRPRGEVKHSAHIPVPYGRRIIRKPNTVPTGVDATI